MKLGPFWMPRPVYDPINRNSIIISTCHEEDVITPGIWKYDTDTKKLQLMYKYDNTILPRGHGHFIDPINKTLILYGGYFKIFVAFDLKTKTIKHTNHRNILRELQTCANHTFNPSPSPEIHILDYNWDHYKFNITNKQTIRMKSKTKMHCSGIPYPKLFYIKSHEKMYVFGGNDSKKIVSYNNNKWKMNQLEMPHSTHHQHYDILNGFDNILVVVYFKCQQIYILNLLQMKWYQCKNVPAAMHHFKEVRWHMHAIQIDINIHFMCFVNGTHFTANIFDIIPAEIIISHRKHFEHLIIGYIRNKVNKLSLQSIPLTLQMLILNFFQLFK